MKYLNHITLNTGHVRQTYPEEVNKSIYFRLKRILNDSLHQDGAEVLDGYRLKTTQAGGHTLATIFGSDGAPILTTACSRNDDGALWRLLHKEPSMPLMTHSSDPPPVPYIADRLEVGAVLHIDAMQWTGDFSRCFGWVVLAPNQIR